MNNTPSILRILNGISKTLNIANQMIPLYKQVKPLITNSGKILNNINNFNLNNNINKTQNTTQDTNQVIKNNKKEIGPTFFQ